MSDRRPTLQEVIDDAVAFARRNMFTMVPAKVVKWTASEGKADCQILIKRIYEDENGDRKVASWPVVTGCPVHFMGAGGFRITFPISDGSTSDATTGMLVFSHASLDKWLASSTPTREVDPELDHDHALNDAVFLPGLMTFASPYDSMSTDKATFGSDSDGDLRIEISESAIEIGANADKGVARGKRDALTPGDTITASSVMAAWATIVETAINVLAPGTFTPANQFSGSGPGNPGADGNLGNIESCSGTVKAVD